MQELLSTYKKDPTLNGLSEDGSPFSVLVVDDSRTCRQQMEEIFSTVGYAVYLDEDLKGGLEQCQKHNPNVIALDMWMPGILALEGLSEFLSKNPGVRIVMISSEFQQARITKALSLGAKDYFLKPIGEKQLKKLLLSFKKLSLEG
jgi:two-component system chemotaxis response regulator CheY